MMLSTKTAARFAARNARSASSRRLSSAAANRGAAASSYWTAAAAAATVTAAAVAYQGDFHKVKCDALPSSGDVLMLGPTKEPATGILFPGLCNGLTFVGCGVRIKWKFIKVYAVGAYMDPMAMSAIKTMGREALEKALLDPMYPRTIRIVMARDLSIDKYTSAITDALEPRMHGQDLEKLDEFKKLNPPVDLVEGAEMEMTIRGDTMLYRNSAGGVGQIKSDVFCRAMCDVYYGKDAVSPAHKEAVLEGIPKMK